MMSPSDQPANKSAAPGDELLSAYFDGELAADRKKQVEQWLSSSPAGRQKLEEFRRLSGFLQELPRAELPSEFAAQVLQQAERQMLLPAAIVTPPRSGLRQVRFWTLSVVAPLTATAALLFIALRQPAPGPQPDERLAQTNSIDAAAPKAASAYPQPILENDIAVASSAVRGARRASSAPTTPAKAHDAEEARPAEVAAGDAKPEASANPEIAAQLAGLVEGIQKANELKQTPVVRVYVVDRSAGMELVQVILDEHHIPREPASADRSPNGDAKSEPLAKPQEAAQGEAPVTGREALFVVADVAELREALEGLLAKNDRALAWKLDDPIDLHRLDRRSQDRVEEALVALGQIAGRGSSAEAAASSNSAAKDDAPEKAPILAKSSAGAATNPGLAAVDSERVGKLRAKEAPARARQVRVLLTENGSIAKASRGEPAEPKRQADLVARDDAPASRPALVRVLLVVEPQPPAAPPADAPPGNLDPAKSKPGDGAA